jgi:hypothetical protein
LIVNARDFVALARTHLHHDCVILAAQPSWTLLDLVMAVDRILFEVANGLLVG